MSHLCAQGGDCKYFCRFLLLSLFSSEKPQCRDNRSSLFLCFLLKIQQMFCQSFLKMKNTDVDARWPRVLVHFRSLCRGAPAPLVWWQLDQALPAAPAAEGRAAPVPRATVGGRGLLAGHLPPGCQGWRAMLPCLSEHGSADLQPAAWPF